MVGLGGLSVYGVGLRAHDSWDRGFESKVTNDAV
jgi:hypothetical protein